MFSSLTTKLTRSLNMNDDKSTTLISSIKYPANLLPQMGFSVVMVSDNSYSSGQTDKARIDLSIFLGTMVECLDTEVIGQTNVIINIRINFVTWKKTIF